MKTESDATRYLDVGVQAEVLWGLAWVGWPQDWNVSESRPLRRARDMVAFMRQRRSCFLLETRELSTESRLRKILEARLLEFAMIYRTVMSTRAQRM